MSDWLEAHPELNIGSKNLISNDVNVADFNYLNQMKKKMLEYQKNSISAIGKLMVGYFNLTNLIRVDRTVCIP